MREREKIPEFWRDTRRPVVPFAARVSFSCPEKCHIFQSLPPRAVTCSALSLRLHLPAGCSAGRASGAPVARSARDPTSPPFASERAAPGLPRALPVASPARRRDGTRAFTGTPSYWRRRAPSSEKREREKREIFTRKESGPKKWFLTFFVLIFSTSSRIPEIMA
jgi:hypothetical protein